MMNSANLERAKLTGAIAIQADFTDAVMKGCRLTRANLLTRIALHDEAELNKALGRNMPGHSESTVSRIRSAGEPLAQYLLFSEEAPLTSPLQGTSGFAEEFARRGPFDKQGRSLREFDLRTRMFKYPCSYLIYSKAFATLPPEVKEYVLKRLHEVLTGKDTSEAFAPSLDDSALAAARWRPRGSCWRSRLVFTSDRALVSVATAGLAAVTCVTVSIVPSASVTSTLMI